MARSMPSPGDTKGTPAQLARSKKEHRFVTSTTQNIDAEAVTAFSERMLDCMNNAAVALMISIGHRTRLFDVMSQMKSATSQELADAAQLNERYVREWLGAMVTGGIVEIDEATGKCWLPPERAACLTRSAAPNNLASMAQWFAVLGGVEDRVVDAFTHGQGIPYDAYHRFHEVMAEESGQTVVAGLDEHILPLVPGIEKRLEQGIDVVDVGCGRGKALMHLAERFPRSRFTGVDVSEEAMTAATAEADERGLRNLEFRCVDAAQWDDREAFDLVLAFDAIHDQPAPERVLENIRRALRPDGIFLMQDIAAASHVHGNLDHPVGPLIYTISCMHCMSVSLAGGGPGLGAAWGKELALEMLGDAGFDEVEVKSLPHDVLNYYYLATPASNARTAPIAPEGVEVS
jgi:SAM-dependent methyltransferase